MGKAGMKAGSGALGRAWRVGRWQARARRRAPVGLMARFLRPFDSSLLQAVSLSAMSEVMPALA